MLFCVSVIFCITLWLWYRIAFARRIKLSEDVPGPPLLPILGNSLILRSKNAQQIFDDLLGHFKKYGGLIRLWIGPFKLAYMSTNPEDIKVILNSSTHIKKGNTYDMLRPWLGDGLLLSDGAKWRSRRKILTPAFHFKVLDDFLEIFQKNSKILRDILLEQVTEDCDRIVDMNPLINSCTLDSICETAMGVELGAQKNSDLPYTRAVHRISDIIWKRRIWLRYDFAFKLLAFRLHREHEECLKTLHGFTDNIIKTRRRQLTTERSGRGTESTAEEDPDLGITRKDALLDILLKASVDGRPLTDAEIREEVDTFVFEGHDTTASAIGFALLLISRNLRVQEKIVEEIKRVADVKADDGKWTQSDLSELKYLEMVIKESLRLYPPVPFVSRRIEKEFDLNGRLIPANTDIGIGVYQMGRNENLFADPLSFIPERFENSTFDPFSFVAFSKGPRDCIGRRFAMLEMKSIFVMIFENFLLSDAKFEPELSPQLVMRSSNGISIGLRRRRRS